jgi:uncharacterized protein YggE
MEHENLETILKAFDPLIKTAIGALAVLALFLFFAAVSELKSFHYIGSGVPASNTITVNGTGDVFAVPDIAEFSATVQEEGSDVKAAQDKATAKINAIYAYLKAQGVEEKDIRTTDYSANPQYEWNTQVCPAGSSYCPGGKQTLTGYQVSQTLSIKVRTTDKAGELLAGVGGKGVSSVSGLNFTIDDQDAVEGEARDKAIADAKTKAQKLAKSLGVSLVRIVGFNENGGAMPYFAKAAAGMSADMAAQSAPSPAIPTGQNKVTSNISLTYEIQ